MEPLPALVMPGSRRASRAGLANSTWATQACNEVTGFNPSTQAWASADSSTASLWSSAAHLGAMRMGGQIRSAAAEQDAPAAQASDAAVVEPARGVALVDPPCEPRGIRQVVCDEGMGCDADSRGGRHAAVEQVRGGNTSSMPPPPGGQERLVCVLSAYSST